MQEQPPYKISADQGWSQMMHILEKELPVARNSRRIMIMWWAAAAVATAFLITVFSLLQNEHIQDPIITDETTIEKSASPIYSDPLPELTDQSSSSITENTSDDVIEAQAAIPENSSLSSLENSEISVRNAVTLVVPKNNISSDVHKISSEVAKINPTVGVIAEPVANNIEAEAPVAQMEQSSIVHTGSAISFLPLTELDLADEFSLPSLQPHVSPSIQRRDLLEASVNVGVKEGYFGGLGMHGGVGLDVNITPRFGLNTAVGLNIYKPDVAFLGNGSYRQENTLSADLLEEDFSNGIGTYLPSYVINNSTGNVISPFIKAIFQWQVSAGAKYQLSRRFCVEGGVAFGFGTTSRSEYPIVDISYGGPVAGDFTRVRNSFDSYQVLERNMTSVYGGIGYKPSNKIELFAHWNHSFDHYLINHPAPLSESLYERTDYIRGLSLGMKYIL